MIEGGAFIDVGTTDGKVMLGLIIATITLFILMIILSAVIAGKNSTISQLEKDCKKENFTLPWGSQSAVSERLTPVDTTGLNAAGKQLLVSKLQADPRVSVRDYR